MYWAYEGKSWSFQLYWKNDHWLNRLISHAYAFVCRCHCMLPLQQMLKKITKYCCCCVSSILPSLLDIIWASYYCSDNGIKVEARTYFATKPNKIKILTDGFRTKIYVCIHTMMQSRFSIYICIFLNLKSLMVIFWFFFNIVAAHQEWETNRTANQQKFENFF